MTRTQSFRHPLNVFTTLLEAHDEVRLHTRFIQCLLDPKGCHDCGSLFLDLFLATLKERPALNHEDKETLINFPDPDKSWEVEKEFRIPDVGQIDILLKHAECRIAIENKPNPDQHKDQIKRYADWLSGEFVPWHVVYLTLHCGQSKTAHGEPYLRISYADHILVWLDKCLRATYAIIPINQVLLQYRAVVSNLTGKNLNSNAMKKISEFIAEHPDIIRFKKQIDEGINEARASFLDRLACGIKEELAAKYGVCATLRPNHRDGRFGRDRYGDLILTPPVNSVLYGKPFKIYVENDTDENALVIGIVTEQFHSSRCSQIRYTELMSAEDKSLFERMDQLLAIDANGRGSDYHKNKAIDGWPTGWHNLIVGLYDDECLASFLDPKPTLAETVSKVCENIKNHIALLEKVYTRAIQPNAI